MTVGNICWLGCSKFG
jgi:hypothetical protein